MPRSINMRGAPGNFPVPRWASPRSCYRLISWSLQVLYSCKTPQKNRFYPRRILLLSNEADLEVLANVNVFHSLIFVIKSKQNVICAYLPENLGWIYSPRWRERLGEGTNSARFYSHPGMQMRNWSCPPCCHGRWVFCKLCACASLKRVETGN